MLYCLLKKEIRNVCHISINKESYVCSCVWLQGSLVLLEDIVDESVPSVENWISEGSGGIAHDTRVFLLYKFRNLINNAKCLD